MAFAENFFPTLLVLVQWSVDEFPAYCHIRQVTDLYVAVVLAVSDFGDPYAYSLVERGRHTDVLVKIVFLDIYIPRYLS